MGEVSAGGLNHSSWLQVFVRSFEEEATDYFLEDIHSFFHVGINPRMEWILFRLIAVIHFKQLTEPQAKTQNSTGHFTTATENSNWTPFPGNLKSICPEISNFQSFKFKRLLVAWGQWVLSFNLFYRCRFLFSRLQIKFPNTHRLFSNSPQLFNHNSQYVK